MTVTVRVSIKKSTANFYNSSNFGLKQTLPNLNFPENFSSGLDQKFASELGVSNIFSWGLKQRLSKLDFGESSSSKLDQTLPNLHFRNISN